MEYCRYLSRNHASERSWHRQGDFVTALDSFWPSRKMGMLAAQNGNNTSEINETSTSPWVTTVPVVLSALNISLSITASLGNALIIVALRKVTSLHPSTKRSFQSLAVTDFCAALVSQSLFRVAVMANIIKINYSHEGYIVTGFILCGISVFTSTAISVDRLLVPLLRLRYRHFVTLRRTRAVIACFFVTGVSCGTMHFWDKNICLDCNRRLRRGFCHNFNL